MLSEQEKWQAVLHCDPAYDGRFFYGVKTTGIFCRPSCRSKAPLRKNVEFFARAADARAQGLRPCKRCRPDLPSYRPDRDLTLQARQIFDAYFADRTRLSAAIRQLAVSRNHLIRLFRQQFGVTPADYLQSLRLRQAAADLAAGGDILDIAAGAGFGSISSFYTCFRKHFGLSPAAYRRNFCRFAP